MKPQQRDKRISENQWKEQRNRQFNQSLMDVSKQEGIHFTSLGGIYAHIDDVLEKHMRCEVCNQQFTTYHQLLKHSGSERCKKRVCEQTGEKYILTSCRRVHCKFCNEAIMKCYFPRHEKSVKHIRNVLRYNNIEEPPVYKCPLCDKDFTFLKNGTENPRSKRDHERHMLSKKHLKKVAITENPTPPAHTTVDPPKFG